MSVPVPKPRLGAPVYPKREPWREWSHERQIAYLEARIRTEQETVARVTAHWMKAADRVKELETRGVQS